MSRRFSLPLALRTRRCAPTMGMRTRATGLLTSDFFEHVFAENLDAADEAGGEAPAIGGRIARSGSPHSARAPGPDRTGRPPRTDRTFARTLPRVLPGPRGHFPRQRRTRQCTRECTVGKRAGRDLYIFPCNVLAAPFGPSQRTIPYIAPDIAPTAPAKGPAMYAVMYGWRGGVDGCPAKRSAR